ncbi:retrovirus-related pol polyprotein from transposon TNT 1-94 [Tanacetum coccineum]|uniref:Retrovirus-related pol polyprotein from transposon TNT 1-94 n=1 Tax=Tanacetum coccineum TaxID=301880 RepID=A0ABQ5D6N7_9ASTR
MMDGIRIFIFVETKKGCDRVTRQLRMDGWPALSIHGDKSQDERDWVLAEFKSGRSLIMSTTDFASCGFGRITVKMRRELIEVLEELILTALQLYVQEGAKDQSGQADMRKLLADQSFMSSILTSLPRVDPNDPSVKDLLASMQNQPEQNTRILELKRRYFEDCYSDNQYAVSIKEDTAYSCLHSPKTTKETSSIRRIQRSPIPRIRDIVCEYSGRYQTWSLLQETPIRPVFNLHAAFLKGDDNRRIQGLINITKSLALKARKVSIDEEVTCSESNDEEYVKAVRDFKKFFRRRGKFVSQPYDDKKNFRKIKEDKKEKEYRSEEDSKKEEICLMALDNNEDFVSITAEPKKIMEKIHVKFDELTAMAFECNNSEPGTNYINFQDSSEDSQSVPSKSDLDNLFGPLYEEYNATSLPEVSDNSVATTLDNENTSLSSSIVIEEDEAPQIVSSSAEQIITKPNSPVLTENTDKLLQEDDAEFNGNVFYNAPQTPMFEEAESSSTCQDPSNMHEFHQKHRSTDKWTKNHPIEQVIGDPSKPVMTRNRLQTDAKVCMYALTVSTIEPKNIKEAMLVQ